MYAIWQYERLKANMYVTNIHIQCRVTLSPHCLTITGSCKCHCPLIIKLSWELGQSWFCSQTSLIVIILSTDSQKTSAIYGIEWRRKAILPRKEVLTQLNNLGRWVSIRLVYIFSALRIRMTLSWLVYSLTRLFGIYS